MLISLLPIRPPATLPETLTVAKAGDVLTIDGDAYDFTGLPDGATYPAVPCRWIFGPVERIDGALHLTLLLPYKVANRDVEPPPPLVDPPDGPIALPDIDPPPEPAPEREQPPASEAQPVPDPEEPAHVDA